MSLILNDPVVAHASAVTASALLASIARIGQVQAPLPVAPTALLAVVAAAAAMVPGIWPLTRHLTLLAHEGAHATLGSAVGRRINGFELRANASGVTHLSGGSRFGNFWVTFIGYLGPSAFGVGAAALISAGYIVSVLWIALVGVFCMLVSLRRRSFGVVTVGVAFLALFGLAGFAALTVQVVTAYALAWFLLVSGVRIIIARGRNADDADKLRGMTRIPASFWSWVWLAGSVAALVFGATLLL